MAIPSLGVRSLWFALFPYENFPSNNLNFHWRWRWWDQIQAIFLDLFYFKWLWNQKRLIKPLNEGKKSESRIVSGEVFTNRVIRTDMPMKVDNARLLLVQESISFHRPDKFVSISNLHLQEEEFVKNICNKIKALNPDLILVSIFQPTKFHSFLKRDFCMTGRAFSCC